MPDKPLIEHPDAVKKVINHIPHLVKSLPSQVRHFPSGSLTLTTEDTLYQNRMRQTAISIQVESKQMEQQADYFIKEGHSMHCAFDQVYHKIECRCEASRKDKRLQGIWH